MQILKEYHSDKDCIYGRLLVGVGRKFNPKKEFVSIIGPASCWVKKECSQDEKRIVEFNSDVKAWNMRGNEGDGFHKKPRLICEPVEGYEGLDYKGGGKHSSKAYGHTPIDHFKVIAINICAICYLDIDRQKRRPEITLIGISLNKEFVKVV